MQDAILFVEKKNPELSIFHATGNSYGFSDA